MSQVREELTAAVPAPLSLIGGVPSDASDSTLIDFWLWAARSHSALRKLVSPNLLVCDSDHRLEGHTVLIILPQKCRRGISVMEMFLMGLCATVLVLGLAVAAVAFGAATRSESSGLAVQPELQVNTVALSRSFSDRVAVSPAAQPRPIPIELLLLQIENHVRLEQAAAESFLAFPTQAQLYRKTASPFVN